MDTVSTPLFIGREYEKSLIQQYLDSPKAELVAIYGRRRVGKTYLVKSFFQNQFDFYFTGMYETSRAVHLSLFRKELSRLTTEKVPPLKDWFTAFDALKDYLKTLNKEKLVVFLDELPWMDTPRSNFLAAFSNFWNTWGSTQPNLKLFVCGSATTWMLDKFVGDKGGLYGRVCRPIHLSPFTLDETEQYFLKIKGLNWGRMQILETYMMMGGIPYYLKQLEPERTLLDNIDNCFFKTNGKLWDEFDNLYETLFAQSEVYVRIVEALASKRIGLTREEIIKVTKLPDNGPTSRALKDLVKCGFVRAYQYFGHKNKSQTYQLADFYTLFYLRFIKDNYGQDEHFWTHMLDNPKKNAWAGYSFEQLIKEHIEQVKRALGIGSVLTQQSSWFIEKRNLDDENLSGAQIDLLIDRRDKAINLCEAKFYSGTFTIDKDYSLKLRDKITTFKSTIKTRKSIVPTMITTFGVKRNTYSGIIQQEATLDDLFT